jgi:ABC-type Mn2+/Zn2+ transport system ATPase subunit
VFISVGGGWLTWCVASLSGVLFLDEPTSGLDSFTATSLIETLHAITRQVTLLLQHTTRPGSSSRVRSDS